MCLVVLAWNPTARERLVLVGHRDEFHGRATAPMDWWTEPRLLAGRDLVAGGTWLGVTADGRFGVVTNLRGAPSPPDPPSRGLLIPRFLAGHASPSAFLAELAADAHRYAGFSLLLGDRDELGYFSNGDALGPQRLAAGLHGLSNAPLGADWPKIRRSRARLADRLAAPLDEPASLLALLDDREPAPDAELPDTGIGLERERALSSPFVVGARYGTRAASAVVLAADGAGAAVERTYGVDGRPIGMRSFRFGAQA